MSIRDWFHRSRDGVTPAPKHNPARAARRRRKPPPPKLHPSRHREQYNSEAITQYGDPSD